MKKWFLLPVLSLAAQLLCGADLLENGSFEIPSEKKSNRNWRFYPAKGWEAYANPKDGNDCRVLTEGAADGSRCIRLISKNKKAMVSMRSDKKLEVKPGDRIFAECMIRGKGKAYIRIYWYGADGKKLPKYYLDGLNAAADWQVFKTNVKVPEGAASFQFSLEIIASLGEIDFDKAVCRVEPGTILDNGKIKAVFNPAIGGGIDSLTLKGIGMDFTQPNQIGNGGGMFNLILPSNRNPGELRFAPAKAEVVTPGQVIRMTQKIDSGDYAGIEAVRTFELLPDSSRIKVNVRIRNTGKKTVETSFRFQSFASSAPGSFTWPTPDWIQIFHQTGEPLNGMNSVIIDLMRAGWIARFYKDAKVTLLYSYDIKKVRRTYNYLVPQFVTNEWYYRPFTLKPGESWSSDAALDILFDQDKPYVDEVALAGKQRLEEIKPVKLPPPPAGEPLPPIFEEFFPAGGGLGNLSQPETAGLEKSRGFYPNFRIISMRLTRTLVDNYFNTVGSVHLMINDAHRAYYKTPDGKHELGEFIRRHRIAFGLGRMLYHRKDTDVEAYKKRLPEIISIYKKPELQKFAHTYDDRLLYINTGDVKIVRIII